MPVRYITVTPIVDLFVPATRSFGDIAIVGAVADATHGPKKTPVPITNPLGVSFQSPQTLNTGAATAAQLGSRSPSEILQRSARMPS